MHSLRANQKAKQQKQGKKGTVYIQLKKNHIESKSIFIKKNEELFLTFQLFNISSNFYFLFFIK